MAGDPRVQELLEELLESGDTPEEVCRDSPELLPQVLKRVSPTARVRRSVRRVVPAAGVQFAGGQHLIRSSRRQICRGSPVMKSRSCWAAAAWASSSGPGTCA